LTHNPSEIIVVANGCSPGDDTANIAQDLGAKVFELEESNVSKARNYGAERAEGRVLIFNDADTIVAPNYIDAINNAVENGTEFGCARFKAESWHPVGLLFVTTLNATSLLFHYAHGNCFAVRKKFEEVGGYNENMFKDEDTDLSEKMKRAAAHFKFLTSTYMIPSERRFREQGHLRLYSKFFVDGLRYMFMPQKSLLEK